MGEGSIMEKTARTARSKMERQYSGGSKNLDSPKVLELMLDRLKWREVVESAQSHPEL